MRKYTIKIIWIGAVLCGGALLSLSACGKKGPLYLESTNKPPAQVKPQPAEKIPAVKPDPTTKNESAEQ